MGNKRIIQTVLFDGSLEGARQIYMGVNSACHLYVLPRKDISLADRNNNIKEVPAFYILLGPKGDKAPMAYIGQTTDFATRKNDHVLKKGFWDVALVFVSANHKIYGDDVRYLEYIGIQAAMDAASYTLDNNCKPSKPCIDPVKEIELEEFFQDIRLLCKFYGCGIFEKAGPRPTDSTEGAGDRTGQHFFYARRRNRGGDGRGFYAEPEGKFVLVEESVLAASVTESYGPTDARDNFIKEHCRMESGQAVLLHDVEFNAPSTASRYILGASSNGWDDWRDAEGRSLGDVYCKSKTGPRPTDAAKGAETKTRRHVFSLGSTRQSARGTGFYDEENGTFVLKEGCVLAPGVTKDFGTKKSAAAASREKFINDHCKVNDGRIVLQHDVALGSPSCASNYILGTSSNGWKAWKDEDGRTLGEVYPRPGKDRKR